MFILTYNYNIRYIILYKVNYTLSSSEFEKSDPIFLPPSILQNYIFYAHK